MDMYSTSSELLFMWRVNKDNMDLGSRLGALSSRVIRPTWGTNIVNHMSWFFTLFLNIQKQKSKLQEGRI